MVVKHYAGTTGKIEVAEIVHELNRMYCASLGDTSQLPWAETSEDIKDSAREGVHAIATGRVTGPEKSHENWFQHKANEGWTYGPTKNPETRQHPCMVPFKMLPYDQRIKDVLFFNAVSTLLAFEEHTNDSRGV